MTEVAGSPLRTLGKIERTTRRELILDKLRAALSSGALAPGTHLAETELSDSLGVSRGTLREALRHLQEDGLLISDSRGRLRVKVVTAQEVKDVFAVRQVLEVLAIEAVCSLPDRTAVVDELREALLLMAAAQTIPEMVNQDLHFHEIMCRAAGNETLMHAWSRVSGRARAAITAAGTATALLNMAVERHRPLLDMVDRGDASGARAFMEDHMQVAAAAVSAHLEAAGAD